MNSSNRLNDLDSNEKQYFINQRKENVDELIRLLETLKGEESIEMWKNSRGILKEKIDKIFNNYEFSLTYAKTKKLINNIK